MYLGTVAVYTTLFTEKRDDLFQHFVLRDAQQGTTLPVLLDQTHRDQRGNVVGLMPHPEHAVEAGFGPNTPAAMRSGIDGLNFFTSAIAAVARAAA